MMNKLQNKKGFTFVELMVALSLFTVIAFISIGALLSIFDANRRAQSSKTIVDNLNYGIESMARTVRFGSNYHCISSGTLSSPQNCPWGDTFLAVTFNGSVVVYRLNGTRIEKSEDSAITWSYITAPEVVIQYLRFYVFGSAPGSGGDIAQPYVLAVVKGYVGNKPTAQSNFTIQTLMSQRALDI